MPRISDLTPLVNRLTANDLSVFVQGGTTYSAPPSGCGTHSIWIPSSAMIPATTNGAAFGTFETATNKVMVQTLDFDATTREYSQFSIRMPYSWDLGHFKISFVWSHAATVTNFDVIWFYEFIKHVDGDPIDAAWTGTNAVSDIGGVTDRTYMSVFGDLSNNYTLSGEELLTFRLYRDAANVNDTLAIDARLHGVMLKYIASAPSDNY